MRSGRIIRGGSGDILLPHVTRTETWIERTRGLLGRESLPRGHGMLIAPCGSIHTFFMRFAIDAVFLDSKGSIVKIVQHLAPCRLAVSGRAASVLELAAGQAAAAGMASGDHLIWEQSA